MRKYTRVAAGAALGLGALALSAGLAAPASAADPYDLRITSVVQLDGATARVHATVVNRGTSSVEDPSIALGSLAAVGATDPSFVSASGPGWSCATDLAVPFGEQVCTKDTTLAPGESAGTVIFTINLADATDAFGGVVVTLPHDDLTAGVSNDATWDDNTEFFFGGPNFGAPSIQGTVWNDQNKDGLQSAGEPGAVGVPVRLYRDGVLVFDGQTGADGSYAIETIQTGDFQISVVAPEGYKHAPAGVGLDDALNSDVNEDGTRALECRFDIPEPPSEEPSVVLEDATVDNALQALGTVEPTEKLGGAGSAPTTVNDDTELDRCRFDIDAALIALPKAPPAGGGGSLAKTGTQVGIIAGIGAALLALGAAVRRVAR